METRADLSCDDSGGRLLLFKLRPTAIIDEPQLAADWRQSLIGVILRSDIKDMKDLKPGMEMRGTVRNVIDFGAFVDIGVHQDGLVHITQISDKFVRHPSDVLKVGDIVTVWVLAVDVARGRISLTMKKPKEQQN